MYGQLKSETGKCGIVNVGGENKENATMESQTDVVSSSLDMDVFSAHLTNVFMVHIWFKLFLARL